MGSKKGGYAQGRDQQNNKNKNTVTDGQLCSNVFRPYFALVWKDKGEVQKLSLQVSNVHF